MAARESPPPSPPALAALVDGLGLRWRPGRTPGQPGELNGIVAGHRVLVRLQARTVSVETRFRIAGLRLDSRALRNPPGSGFSTGDADFDRCFPLRTGPAELRAALSADTPAAVAFRRAAVALPQRPGRPIARMQWDSVHLIVHLRRPSLAARLFPRSSGRSTGGVDAMLLAALLPDMVSLAEALETTLRTHALGRMTP